MKIAFLHFDLCGGPQHKNIQKLLKGIEQAAANGADWVLTPEMAMQGYHMTQTGYAYSIASKGNGLYKDFCAIAEKYNIYIFLGCAEQVDSTAPAFNSCVVINNRGEIIGKHSKIKTVKWITEAWSQPGRSLMPLECQKLKTGILVCADAWFAEQGKLLADKNAELIVVIAAWPPNGCGGPPEKAWERCSNVSGGLPVFVCNQTGSNGMDCRKAESAVIDKGKVLFTYSGSEAILTIDVDTENKKILSEYFMIKIFK